MNTPVLRTRRAPLVPVVLLVVALAACTSSESSDNESVNLGSGETEGADPSELVTIVLPSPPGIPHTPYFVAEAMGYYAEEGLSVELVNVTGGQDANRIVATGEGHFAFPAPSSVMTAKSDGLPITSVFTHRQDWIFGFATLADSGIRSIEDLEGRSVGVISESAANIARLMMVGAGIEVDNVEIEIIGGNMAGPLAAGQVDAIYSWSTLYEQYSRQGIDQTWIDSPVFSDYQSNVLIASDELISSDPELVAGFLRGTVKGLVFTKENPAAALEILADVAPDAYEDPDEALVELEIAIQESESDLTAEHGFGYHNAVSWEQQQDVLVDLGLLSEAADPGTYWTNDFIEAANDFDLVSITDEAQNYG